MQGADPVRECPSGDVHERARVGSVPPFPPAGRQPTGILTGLDADRCSVTLAVLSTVNVRTCVGCERKALLALDGGRPEDGKERLGVIDTVLKVATCCLYCGGRWMRIR